MHKWLLLVAPALPLAAQQPPADINWQTNIEYSAVGDPQRAPTLTIHGTADRFVAYEQGIWIHEALKKSGVESELLTLKGADHGFREPEYAKRAEEALIAWFDSHLKYEGSR